MKKYFLLLLFLSFGFIGISQEKDCKFNYSTSIEFGKPEQPWEAFAILSYDFSNLNLKSENINIEVVGILDCWNNLEGSDLRDLVVILDSKNENFNDRGTINIMHESLMAKCFKYRVVIKNNKCEELSDWKFVTYNF